MSSLVRIYIRICKKRARSYFTHWRMLTELRKQVTENYSIFFDNNGKGFTKEGKKSGELSITSDERLYTKIRIMFCNLSSNYAEKMTKTIANNIKEEHYIIKSKFNLVLGEMINELMDELN